MMQMTFYNSVHVTLWIDGWSSVDLQSYVILLTAVVLFAVLHEGLYRLRQVCSQVQLSGYALTASACAPEQSRNGSGGKVVRASLAALHESTSSLIAQTQRFSNNLPHLGRGRRPKGAANAKPALQRNGHTATSPSRISDRSAAY
jgi:hypothetical protein